MKKKGLVWHIYPSYLILSLVAMTAVAVSSIRIIRVFHYEQMERELTSATTLVIKHLQARGAALTDRQIDELCKSTGNASGYRVTVIAPSGVVKGDSEKNPATMDNHGKRDEVLEALSDGRGSSQRYSDTLQEDMMYVALPMPMEGSIGVVRASKSLASIDQAIAQVWGQILLAALIIALLAVLVTALFIRRISRPLEKIRHSLRSFGHGGSYERLPSSRITELDVLANTINVMADQLNERIVTIREQSEQRSALLSCMIESVLAVDTDKNLIRINTAAEEMFDIISSESVGRSVMEVVRNADLLELVDEALASDSPVERDVFLADSNIYLQGHGSVLRGADGSKIGALLVLHDITRLRNIERMRRDFVANVSHELKTPITSILGYAETLCDGASENKRDRDEFIAIIEKQATRLKSIVEDLLALSEIEDDVQKGEVALQEFALAPILRTAVSACRSAAEKSEISVTVECEEELEARINDALLEQAIINLIGNAIRYSEPGTKVMVSACGAEREIAIRVEDQGPGIDSKHLSRLFERFYRVDKGRSRKLGGTGLGLAIVKHVAIAHHGRVDVKSELGQGSTFTIYLPKS